MGYGVVVRASKRECDHSPDVMAADGIALEAECLHHAV